MRSGFRWAVSVAVLGVPVSFASAGMVPDAITGVTAVGFNDGDGDAAGNGNGGTNRVVDGTGLTAGATPALSTHSTAWQEGWQGDGATSGWFVADLQGVHSDLQSMYIWNVKEGVPSSPTQYNRGANAIEIFYATSPTVAPAMNAAYSFASGGWTSLISTNVPVSSNTGLDHTVDLSAINSNGGARYIGIRLDSNHGATSPNRVGFAEIQFTTVPEPGALGLLGIGLASILVRRCRKA